MPLDLLINQSTRQNKTGQCGQPIAIKSQSPDMRSIYSQGSNVILVWHNTSAELWWPHYQVPRLGDKSIKQLTVLWHKQPHWWADHAAPCLCACGHLHTVGWVEFLHFYKGHGGVCVDLEQHTADMIQMCHDEVNHCLWWERTQPAHDKAGRRADFQKRGTFGWKSTLRNSLYVCATSHSQLGNFAPCHILCLTVPPSPFFFFSLTLIALQHKKGN